MDPGGSNRDARAGAGTDRLRHRRGNPTGSVSERHRFEAHTGIEPAPATSLDSTDSDSTDPEDLSGDR